MPRMVEDLTEFVQRQGGNPLKINGMFVFENGARCDETGSIRSEPPLNPTALREVQLLFLREQLRFLVDDLNQFVNHCESQASFVMKGYNVPPPPMNAPDIVRRYKQDIRALEARIADMEAKNTITPTQWDRDRQRSVSAREERRNNALRLRESIRAALNSED